MEKYQAVQVIGEGTYGVVTKCRVRGGGPLVAIKRFKESDSDPQVRRVAAREIQLLRLLNHDNIVNLLECFRQKGKLHLVFEYCERTVLEDLDANPTGLPEDEVKRMVWSLLRSVDFCHSRGVVHRDIKPENLLLTKHGVLKLCDFGFARQLTGPQAKYTEYVATRWYRAPELLVGHDHYGAEVDVWAIGCMFAEALTGEPLFAGDSDLDQLSSIMELLGSLPSDQASSFNANPFYEGYDLPPAPNPDNAPGLIAKFPTLSEPALSFLSACLAYEPSRRSTAAELLCHPYIAGDAERYHKDQLVALAADERDANYAAFKARCRNARASRPRRKKPKPLSQQQLHQPLSVASVPRKPRSQQQQQQPQQQPRQQSPQPRPRPRSSSASSVSSSSTSASRAASRTSSPRPRSASPPSLSVSGLHAQPALPAPSKTSRSTWLRNTPTPQPASLTPHASQPATTVNTVNVGVLGLGLVEPQRPSQYHGSRTPPPRRLAPHAPHPARTVSLSLGHPSHSGYPTHGAHTSHGAHHTSHSSRPSVPPRFAPEAKRVHPLGPPARRTHSRRLPALNNSRLPRASPQPTRSSVAAPPVPARSAQLSPLPSLAPSPSPTPPIGSAVSGSPPRSLGFSTVSPSFTSPSYSHGILPSASSAAAAGGSAVGRWRFH